MDARELLGKRIRSIRSQMGLSQEEVAFRCGMQPSHIGFLERGQRNPSLETLERLALGLGISLSELFDYDQEPKVQMYDETTNKILSLVIPLNPAEKKQVHAIVKAFVKKPK
ncbi:MAG: helix-turn-helix transcriptional regulator [Clostridia bacterium]|nr:helix-turn-helix transcriptional regulator [Clostridia bacterium]